MYLNSSVKRKLLTNFVHTDSIIGYIWDYKVSLVSSKILEKLYLTIDDNDIFSMLPMCVKMLFLALY